MALSWNFNFGTKRIQIGDMQALCDKLKTVAHSAIGAETGAQTSRLAFSKILPWRQPCDLISHCANIYFVHIPN